MLPPAAQRDEARTGSRADGWEARDPRPAEEARATATPSCLPTTLATGTPAGGVALDPPRRQGRRREGIRLGAPLRGRIERLVQGRRYAFLRLQDGRSVYVHWSALRGVRFAELHPRQSVRCWLEIGSIGLQAARVEPCRNWRRARKRHARGERAHEKAGARTKTPAAAVLV